MEEQKPVITKKKKSLFKKILMIFGIFLLILFLLPFLLYIGPVQDFVKDLACEKVSESTGLEISIGDFSLDFPLDITIDDVLVLDAQKDTMASCKHVGVGVSFLPLFLGDVVVDEVQIDSVYYKMESEDGSLTLIARIGDVVLDKTTVELMVNRVRLSDVALQKGDVYLFLDNRKAEPSTSDSISEPSQWLLEMDKLSLKDVKYHMAMMPVIDSLAVDLPAASISDVAVNLLTSKVSVKSLDIDSLNAAYFTPTLENAEMFAQQLPQADTVVQKEATRPWTIMAKHLNVNNSSAIYAVDGVSPQDGFDVQYISANNININIEDFYNQATKVIVPIKKITASERCGVNLAELSGLFSMDSIGMKAENLKLKTDVSNIDLDAVVDNSFFSGELAAKLDLSMKSSLSLVDAEKILPSMSGVFEAMNPSENAVANIEISGTGRELNIENIDFDLPNIVYVLLDGKLEYPMIPGQLGGKVNLDGKLTGGNFIRKYMKMDSTLHVPDVNLKGTAGMYNSNLTADLEAVVDTGTVVIDGSWNMNSERYSGNLAFSDFDVRTLMPKGSIGLIDGEIAVDGKGYDIYSMTTNGNVVMNRVDFNGVTYNDLSLDAAMNQGNCNLDFTSPNSFADLSVILSGRISPDIYELSLGGNINNLDLKYMNFSEDRLNAHANLNAKFFVKTTADYYGALLALEDIDVAYKYDRLKSDSLNVGFVANPGRTYLRMREDDMLLNFNSNYSLSQWSDTLSSISSSVDSMMRGQRVNIATLKKKILPFELDFNAGKLNLISKYLATTGVDFKILSLNVNKKEDLDLNTVLSEFKVGVSTLDTLRLDCHTRNDSLQFWLHAGNTAKPSQKMKSADLDGYLYGNKLSIELAQYNLENKKTFNLGAALEVEDSVARLSLLPEHPIIANRQWTLNKDNYILCDFKNKLLNADFELKGQKDSYIKLYTKEKSSGRNSVNVDIAGVSLKDWLNVSPFAPPLDGVINTQMEVYYNNKYIWGKGGINLTELKYGKKRVGTIDLAADVAYAGDGSKIFSKLVMDVDAKKVLTVQGYYNDTIPVPSYYMELDVKRFPLQSANAFLPDVVGKTTGYLNGDMLLTGTVKDPKLNGYIQFDSTMINMPVYGVKFNFDTIKIPVEDGKVHFNKYDLFSVNNKSITVDGSVNLLPLDKMYADLKIGGQNVQVVKSKKTSKSEIFGNGFIDLRALVKGYMNELDMTAELSVLPGTNLTYVMRSSASAIMDSNANEDVVSFVQFNDTTKKNSVDSIVEKPFSMRITALLNIKPNAVLNVYLSPNGKDRVLLDGDGSFNFAMTHQGDMNMTGRYSINSGFVRYSPPMLSEKLFYFVEGSNISFHGDILNPHMNIKAVQTIKGSVATDNQDTRVVPFDITLMIGNTLSELDVQFDLSTEGDMTIANELSGMTQEERSAQAMNLLLYNTYTGPSSKSSSGNFSENMAFSFLESTLNKWAANNISGVDISFGIDQYDKTVDGNTASTMNYSYQVSKSVFNDRFKIVVGGSYSSDDSHDNIAQNLFNDVSFEYKLNSKGSSVIKLFHKTEYENILEGEIRETGVGFVWKRKIASWKDMFRFVKRLKKRRQDRKTAKDETESDVQVKAEDK